jgi:hypothetical protein
LTKQGQHDFLNNQGIVNLAESSAAGRPIVHGQILPLKEIEYKSLPNTQIPTPGLVFVPDHPVAEKVVMFFDGTGWSRLSNNKTKLDAPVKALVLPGSSVSLLTTIGINILTTGTINTVSMSSINSITKSNRFTIASTTAIGGVGSIRSDIARFWGGGAAGEGGWSITIPFGGVTLNAGMRSFIGLDSNTAVSINADPLTYSTTSRVGVALNNNTGVWSLVHNAAGVAPTVIPLTGVNIDVTTMYILNLSKDSNSSTINYNVINKATNTLVKSDSLSSNIPLNTTFLTLNTWVTNNTSSVNVFIAIGEISAIWNI